MSKEEKLDFILTHLNKRKGSEYLLDFLAQQWGRENSQISEYRILVEKLLADGYTRNPSDLMDHQTITPKGVEFIENGGYVAQKERDRIQQYKASKKDELELEEKRSNIINNRNNIIFFIINLILGLINIILLVRSAG